MIDTIVVDADSIAVAAGVVEHPEQVCFAVDAKLKQIKEASKCTTLIGFVERWDWKQNFRKHVAVSQPYKGGRGSKPQWTDDAKKYLVDRHNFSVVTFMESEDCVACTMRDIGIDKCYGAAIDKDIIYGVAGSYYNYKKDEWVQTTAESAARYEAFQFLMGDSGDGIAGCPGVGEKTARPIIAACESVEQLPMAVAEVYKSRGHPYAYLLEQCRLIHIRRAWDEPPFTPITIEQWESIEV